VRHIDSRIYAALLSLLASVWCVSVDDVINNDGILYIRSAAELSGGDWGAAFQLYNWPLYPWLISVVSQVFGCSLEGAAHWLDAICWAIAVVAFMTLVEFLGGTKKVVWLSGLVILCYSSLNDYRSSVIRDPGYLAFYLLGVLAFFKFCGQPRWVYATAWGLSMLVATLFRIEGILFLILAPFSVLFIGGGSLLGRGKNWLRVNTVLLVLSAAALVLWCFGDHSPAFSVVEESRLRELGTNLDLLGRRFTETLPKKAELVAKDVLGPLSESYAPIVLALAIFIVFVVETVKTLTVLNGLLGFHALRSKLVFQGRKSRGVWLTFVSINLVFLLTTTVLKFSLTDRIGLAFSLTLMIAAPFSLAALHDRWRDQRRAGEETATRRKWVFVAVCVWFAVSTVDGLVSFGPSKLYLREAGVWIRDNRSSDTRVFSNDQILDYYAGIESQDPKTYSWERTMRTLESGLWKDYDLLAVRVKRKQQEQADAVLAILKRGPTKEFKDRRGGRVLVFETGRSE